MDEGRKLGGQEPSRNVKTGYYVEREYSKQDPGAYPADPGHQIHLGIHWLSCKDKDIIYKSHKHVNVRPRAWKSRFSPDGCQKWILLLKSTVRIKTIYGIFMNIYARG